MEIKKTFLIILSGILSLSGLLFANPAKADSYYESIKFIPLPSGNMVSDGYLNSLSTSFRTEVELSSGYAPDALNLYLDNCVNPIDSEVYDTARNYILSSGTATNQELQDLFASCSTDIEGIHQIFLKGITGTDEITIWQYQFVADFHSPTGSFQINNFSGKNLLKVGDSVELSFVSNDSDIESIQATIYGRELTFAKNGGLFESVYTVQEGDDDISDNIIINDVKITDLANNTTSYDSLAFPIDFTIDANSPQLIVTSPENKTYNTRNIKLEYQASGYDDLKFYLDGREIGEQEFANLAEGSHVLRIVAKDMAGNTKEVTTNFKIDATPPTGSLINPPSSITEGEKLSLQGKTEPGATVRIEVDGSTLEKVAGPDGSFSFDVEGLSLGEHEIFLTFIDPLGNENRILALKVLVNAKQVIALEQESDDEGETVSEPIQLALADTVPDDMSDVETGLNLDNLPALVQEDNGIISEFGQTSERSSSQAWLYLGIIVVFSIFLSAVSYNFYSKLVALKSLSDENSNQEYINEELVVTSSTLDEVTQFKEPEIKPDPEEPKETLRW